MRAGYGEAVVLHDVSFELADRGSLALLGRNGVGKSTLMLTIMGFTNMTRGSIFWKGEDITRMPPHRRARAGIGWVAQEREIFQIFRSRKTSPLPRVPAAGISPRSTIFSRA